MNRLLGIAVIAGWFAAYLPGPVRAQVVFRTGDAGTGFQQINPLGQSTQWLFVPSLEKEFDIVPEQKEALAKLRTEVLEKMRSLWTSTGGEPQGRMQRYQDASQALAEETEKKIQEILLPHQLRRLSQVALQMKLRQTGNGSANALAGDDLAKELGITDEQKAQLRAKEQEVAREIRERTLEFQKKLQGEAREKLLSVLTPAQRKRLEEMTGEQLEWQPPALGAPVMLPAGGTGGATVVSKIEIDRAKEQIESLKKSLP